MIQFFFFMSMIIAGILLWELVQYLEDCDEREYRFLVQNHKNFVTKRNLANTCAYTHNHRIAATPYRKSHTAGTKAYDKGIGAVRKSKVLFYEVGPDHEQTVESAS